ncbi:hypothetical protein [Enterococcus gallinarum]|uniref:hypothetical protein n=1 Tax=Enterococcus gallinarum TaxID=1353 RepID=UPI0020BF0938|nr:hypothetical protein [Enterococcus gallinarum]
MIKLNDRQKEFQRLYVSNDYSITDEMRVLFHEILSKDFEDDPDKMDSFIHSIVVENTVHEPSELELLKQENEEMKQRQEMAEEALLNLSDMLLSR